VATIVIFIVLIAVLWFVMIRPQQRRQREAQQMQAELAPGANVMLTSGIFGVVREITDDYLRVEISEGASVKVVRAAIGRVLPEDFGEQPAAEAEPGTEAGVVEAQTEEPSAADGAAADNAAADSAADSAAVEPIEPEDDR